jgi:polysaccharide export outer membrane protein
MPQLRLLVLFLLLSCLSSCKLLYPNFLLRENKDHVYFEIKEQQAQAQLIVPGDRISFVLKARNGIDLIDVISGGGAVSLQGNIASYLVKEDGNVELPVLGDVKVQGLTIKQLEDLMEQRYSGMYNDPFVIVQIVSRRAYVFMGVGEAQVVPLDRDNIKVIELLATVGGIPATSKSNRIRIIRGDYDHPSIKRIDLSTIEGLKDADFIIQPNDLIIVDPAIKVAPAILTEITPWLSLITTGLTLYLIFKK